MSVLRSDYNLEKHIDEVWYESSNVIYSKFKENEEDNTGTLEVVFKGGKRYEYQKVVYQDYLSFKRGLVEGSSGKAFNEYIIKKYKGEKLDDASVDELMSRLHSPKESEVTYFIHGDGPLDEDIFQLVYANAISYALDISSDSRFAVQYFDKYGMRALEFLSDCKIDPDRVTIYIPESKIENFAEKHLRCRIIRVKDTDWDERFIENEIMRRSFEDIAFISNETLDEIRKISRSAYIILNRRMS
jgi:hypothetical protein